MEKVICFVLMFVTCIYARHEIKKPSIQLAMNSIATNCTKVTDMTAEQVESAIKEKNIKRISPCFMKCYLGHFGLINEVDGKETVNVPMTLIFVKIYLPDISIMEIFTVGVEVNLCAKEFEKNSQTDDQPTCPKTKSLVSCLAKRKPLMNAFWLATRGE